MKFFGTLFVILISLFFCLNTFSQTSYYNEIKSYSDSLYNSFDKLQQRISRLSFSDTARSQWNNLPVGLKERKGLSIGKMKVEQRILVHRILSASLSSQGYLKATSIMHLDNLLNIFVDSMYERKEFTDTLYRFLRDLKWSNQNYYFAFFGDPRTDLNWGFKLEGHHLSLNFTFTNKQISNTPMFVGTDPAEYPILEYAGWRVLLKEEDYGLHFIKNLTPSQRMKAISKVEVPKDIITGAESGKRLIDYWGIKGSELSKSQKEILKKIIREFVFNLENDKAKKEYEKILKAGIENIYFGWVGEIAEKKPHYYVINGPTFIIEFDNNSGPREVANHIHAIWREKGNEYGEDLLKQHYLKEKH